MFGVNPLKRVNPYGNLGLFQNKRRKLDDQGQANLFWLHFKFQVRALEIKNLKGNFLSDASIRTIASIAYDILFHKLKTPLQICKITKRKSVMKFFHSAICLNKTCCIFRTNRALGSGAIKSAYEALLIEMDANRDLSSVKVSSVALLIIKENGSGSISEVLHEDDLAGCFTSPYIVKKSIYRVVLGAYLLLVQKRFAFDFETAIRNNTLPPLDKTIRAIGDAADGLAVLHENGIIHRDLKPGNLAFKMNERGLLFDLGFAEHNSTLKEIRGSPLYTAPELALDTVDVTTSLDLEDYFKNEQTPETDLWAFGILLFEICSPSHKPPSVLATLETYDQLQETLLIIRKNEIEFHAQLFEHWQAKDQIEQKLQNFIRKLLSIDPKNRGTARELSTQLRQIFKTFPVDYAKRRLIDSILFARVTTIQKKSLRLTKSVGS